MTRAFNIAVVGATGAVGEAMLAILAERNFPVDKIYPLASHRSAGKTIRFKGMPLTVGDLQTFDFTDVDIGLFSPGAAVSRVHAPRAAAAGCIVVDNTSEFRYDDDVPLVVPEVNASAVADYTRRGIIANPNCSTIQMVVALKPINDIAGIERVNVCTYQAVSGTGKEAITELREQSADVLHNRMVRCDVYPQQIAFNVLPHIDSFQDNGYTKEEMKMIWETRKILGDDRIQVNPTAVRVPVFFGHSEAIHIETREKISVVAVRAALRAIDGVEVIDDPDAAIYPTAVGQAAGKDAVFVGRIREDISHPRGVNLWVVSDNVRKGAALNSVQIAEILVKDYL